MFVSRQSRTVALYVLLGLFAVVLVRWSNAKIPCATQLSAGVFLIGWMVSVKSRVINPNVLCTILHVGAFLLLYMLLQMCKYVFFDGLKDMKRWLWYAYYIPMTVVPLLVLTIACRMGAGISKSRERALRFLWIPCLLLIAGFMSNDFHRLAFGFPQGIEFGDSGNTREIWYYLFLAWTVLLLLCTLYVLIRRCRVTGKKNVAWVPLCPLAVGSLYLAVMTLRPAWITINGLKFMNMGEVFLFLIVGFIECCIQIGLLPANSGYGELFHASSLSAVLADKNGHLYCRTAADRIPNTEECLEAVNGSFYPDTNTRINSAPVQGGTVCWLDDLTELNSLNDRIREMSERIREKNEYLSHEKELQTELAAVEARSALYDRISSLVQLQTDRLGELLANLPQDENAFRHQLAVMTVYVAFIKRRSNMELLAAEKGTLPFTELVTALRESVEYICLCGTDALCTAEGEGLFSAAEITDFYDFFENAVEVCLENAKYMHVHLSGEKEKLTLRLMLAPAESLRVAHIPPAPDGCRLSCLDEDGERMLVLSQGREEGYAI